MFDVVVYRQYLYSLIQKQVLYKNKDITNLLVEALLVFDAPITKTINITKQTLYKKYNELLDLSHKPSGTYLNLWLLEQYGYKYCKECKSVKNLDNFGKDKQTITGIHRLCKTCSNNNSNHWKKQNRAIVNTYQKAYYYNNIDFMREKSKQYQKTHKAIVNANSAKKRASKLQATPSWLSDEQYCDIKNFYYAAKQLELETTVKYHVDHIVPLQGENVCGLHVPWNLQVIPAADNIAKSNRYFEEYNV